MEHAMTTANYLSTGFGLGRLPWAPGTWACLPPVILYQVLGYLCPPAVLPTMLVFLLVGSWATLTYGSILRTTGSPVKPSGFVADVLAGQSLTMLLIAILAPGNICNSMALGFALYRFFDVLQPWPCERLRQKPGGLGLLADDLMAGTYAGAIAFMLILLLPAYF